MDFLTPEALRRRGGMKWTYYDPDVLGASIAEMDYGLAPAIADALRDAVDRADTAYSYPLAEERTARAATAFWESRLGWSVDPTWVYPVPDVLVGIRRAISRLTRPGSPVVLHTPVYFPFFGAVADVGRELVEVQSSVGANGRYRVDIDGVERSFAAGAGSIVLCNPWNPTGRCLDASEVDEIVALAAAHGARVISDEVHAPFLYDGAEHIVAAARDSETVITVTSASKAWNLPGLKCAQLVLTNEADRSAWEAWFTPDKVGVGVFGMIANEAAYSDGIDWFDDVLIQLGANRKLLSRLLASHLPDVRYSSPEGTYLAWLDFGAYGLENPAEHLLEHARVGLGEGGRFRGGAETHVRLNFATSPEILIEIVERIAAVL